MARQVLPWVGAAVGFMIGGPGGAQAGMMIGGLIGNAVDPQVINGPKLGEGQDNTASEGGYRPIVLGKGAVGVCMIHEGPLKKRTIRHRQSKGGGPVTTEERAYRTMAFALGESANPDAGVALTRLWIDNKLRYDVTPTSQILQESMEFASQFTFYPGDETQEPDPDLEAFLGAGNVPSYRGGSPYIVLPDWDVTDSRGMAPMIKAEISTSSGAVWRNAHDPRVPGVKYEYALFRDFGQHTWHSTLAAAQADSIRDPVVFNSLLGWSPEGWRMSRAYNVTPGGAADLVLHFNVMPPNHPAGYVGATAPGSAGIYCGELTTIGVQVGDPWVWWSGEAVPHWTGGDSIPLIMTRVPEGQSGPSWSQVLNNCFPPFPVTRAVGSFDARIRVRPVAAGGSGGDDGEYAWRENIGTLAGVVQFCHHRAGMPLSSIDVSELTDPVEGVVFADGYTAADAIRAASGWYFFDAGEFDNGSGYKIHYVKRGGPAVATLTEADIVDGPEDWEREDSYERPRVLHVAYQNPVADYGAPTVPIKRTSPDVLVVGERSVNVPFVHSDQDEVARRGDIALTVIYTEIGGTYEIVLPLSWLALAPTDNIGFSIRGRTRRLAMTSWRFSPDGTIKTEWRSDRQSAYTSNLTALPPPPSAPPPPSIVGGTISAALDIPALVDAMDSLHLVVAASGQTPAWHGSIHQLRLPTDSDFATAAQFSAPTTIMGILQGSVSQASQHYTDTTNVVRVKLYSDDELETYTQQQFLSEHGAFALAWNDGGIRRWEVCQYRDAVKVGEKEWELSTLMRGRLSTTTAPHPAGSMFVLLDSGIRSFPAQSSWIGQDITHRAVSSGQLPDLATPYTEPYTGASQREWPVSNVLLSVAGSELNVAVVPRHRFGTDDHPLRSINWTGYRIEATDGTRTAALDTASESASIDIAGWSGTITVAVAQINRITGAGPAVSETIDA